MITKEKGDWPDIFTGRATPEQVAAAAKSELEGRMSVAGQLFLALGMTHSGMYIIPEQYGIGMVRVSRFLGINDVFNRAETELFHQRLMAEWDAAKGAK